MIMDVRYVNIGKSGLHMQLGRVSPHPGPPNNVSESVSYMSETCFLHDLAL